MDVGEGRIAADHISCHLKSVAHSGGRAKAHSFDCPSIPAHNDHLANVFKSMRAPIPHIKRVHAVIGVRRPIQVSVPLVFGVTFFIFLLDCLGIGAVGQHLFKKIDVAGVVDGVISLVTWKLMPVLRPS